MLSSQVPRNSNSAAPAQLKCRHGRANDDIHRDMSDAVNTQMYSRAGPVLQMICCWEDACKSDPLALAQDLHYRHC